MSEQSRSRQAMRAADRPTVPYSDPLTTSPATLTDYECAHGVIGRCAKCDRAASSDGHSIIRRGLAGHEHHEAPATLVDFECRHLVIGPCADCELEGRG